ncbi:hypothetical protein SERLA73DRAFT_75594 [Serpula lacrymans var. lacrymans S7.3]|uniref:Uncharacterized protein n=2 Tax=Serpula lacrymans var. lacrymans TaxID=341189 RepID=F8Q593_SERL3|nr:uncharacterized protein SERLADRAFT_440358 [Serpula lacrymans var. lacrymans S7.9]EGN96720.1 hypothetical protein SERLA73DRAFT_75594 [Serpula lacrymans var. lacrymans S7.3]EGO22333.1 hypothetical protein SERLADRAFT_440358 [Serpula lacrymans var. lacrymans S7.9]
MGVEPGKSKNEAAGIMANDMKPVLDEMHKALFRTAEQTKDRAEHRHSKTPDYKSRKLTKKWIGPYRIKEVKPNAVELELQNE